MADETVLGGFPKVLVDSAAGAAFTAIGGVVLHWLGLSVEGAICGGAILGLPAFVAVHGVLTNREMRKRLAAMETRLSLPAAPAPIAASESGSGGSATALIKRLTTPLSASAIGVFREISIQFFKPGSTPQFRCICIVDFYGISAQRCSPSELRLTTKRGAHVLAKLEAERINDCPGAMFYEGVGDWAELMKVASDTMGHVERQGLAAWEKFTPNEILLFDVEIRLPIGDAGHRHLESSVKLASEFGSDGIKSVRLAVHPWKSFEPASITITPL